MLRHKLKPIVFLIMNVFKSACWTALFAVSLWNAFRVVNRTVPGIVSLVVDIVLLYVTSRSRWSEDQAPTNQTSTDSHSTSRWHMAP